MTPNDKQLEIARAKSGWQQLPCIRGKEFSIFGVSLIWSNNYLYMENERFVQVFDQTGAWKRVCGRLFRRIGEL